MNESRQSQRQAYANDDRGLQNKRHMQYDLERHAFEVSPITQLFGVLTKRRMSWYRTNHIGETNKEKEQHHGDGTSEIGLADTNRTGGGSTTTPSRSTPTPGNNPRSRSPTRPTATVLVQATAKGSADDDPPILIPESVIWENNIPKGWYYFDPKEKQVFRRKVETQAIQHSFLRGAKYADDVVATLYTVTNIKDEYGAPELEYQFITAAGLERYLFEGGRGKGTSLLQQFVMPLNSAHNDLIQSIWSPEIFRCVRRQNIHELADDRVDINDRCITFEGKTHLSRMVQTTSRLENQVKTMSEVLVRHFNDVEGRSKITRIVCFFKMDRHSQLQLLCVTSARVIHCGSDGRPTNTSFQSNYRVCLDIAPRFRKRDAILSKEQKAAEELQQQQQGKPKKTTLLVGRKSPSTLREKDGSIFQPTALSESGLAPESWMRHVSALLKHSAGTPNSLRRVTSLGNMSSGSSVSSEKTSHSEPLRVGSDPASRRGFVVRDMDGFNPDSHLRRPMHIHSMPTTIGAAVDATMLAVVQSGELGAEPKLPPPQRKVLQKTIVQCVRKAGLSRVRMATLRAMDDAGIITDAERMELLILCLKEDQRQQQKQSEIQRFSSSDLGKLNSNIAQGILRPSATKVEKTVTLSPPETKKKDVVRCTWSNAEAVLRVIHDILYRVGLELDTDSSRLERAFNAADEARRRELRNNTTHLRIRGSDESNSENSAEQTVTEMNLQEQFYAHVSLLGLDVKGTFLDADGSRTSLSELNKNGLLHLLSRMMHQRDSSGQQSQSKLMEEQLQEWLVPFSCQSTTSQVSSKESPVVFREDPQWALDPSSRRKQVAATMQNSASDLEHKMAQKINSTADGELLRVLRDCASAGYEFASPEEAAVGLIIASLPLMKISTAADSTDYWPSPLPNQSLFLLKICSRCHQNIDEEGDFSVASVSNPSGKSFDNVPQWHLSLPLWTKRIAQRLSHAVHSALFALGQQKLSYRVAPKRQHIDEESPLDFAENYREENQDDPSSLTFQQTFVIAESPVPAESPDSSNKLSLHATDHEETPMVEDAEIVVDEEAISEAEATRKEETTTQLEAVQDADENDPDNFPSETHTKEEQKEYHPKEEPEAHVEEEQEYEDEYFESEEPHLQCAEGPTQRSPMRPPSKSTSSSSRNSLSSIKDEPPLQTQDEAQLEPTCFSTICFSMAQMIGPDYRGPVPPPEPHFVLISSTTNEVLFTSPIATQELSHNVSTSFTGNADCLLHWDSVEVPLRLLCNADSVTLEDVLNCSSSMRIVVYADESETEELGASTPLMLKQLLAKTTMLTQRNEQEAFAQVQHKTVFQLCGDFGEDMGQIEVVSTTLS